MCEIPRFNGTLIPLGISVTKESIFRMHWIYTSACGGVVVFQRLLGWSSFQSVSQHSVHPTLLQAYVHTGTVSYTTGTMSYTTGTMSYTTGTMSYTTGTMSYTTGTMSYTTGTMSYTTGTIAILLEL